MAERAPTTRRTRRAPPASPLSFRMPATLRSRLRRFAEERSLGEAEALRLALSEHLNAVDSESELAAAERWQFAQAYATWQEHLHGGRRDTVGWDAIERLFKSARSGQRSRKRAPK